MFKSIPFIFALLSVSYGGEVQGLEAVTLSFEEAARFALSENPDLLALRHQEEAFKYRAKQALAPANPVITAAKNDLSGLSPFSDSASTSYTVTFTLGFPGKAYYASRSVHRQAESMAEQGLSKEIDLLTGLSNNYVSLAVNRAFFVFLTEERKKAADLEKLVEKKFGAGQAARVDLLNAQVAVVNEDQALLANGNERDLLITTFLNLIKKPGSKDYLPLIPTEIRVPELSMPLEDLKKLMFTHRHVLKAAKLQVEAADALTKQNFLAAFPDFQLSGSINDYRIASLAPIANVGRDYSLSIGIAIPLFYPFSELQGLRASARDAATAAAQYDSQNLQALADLQTFYTSFKSSEKAYNNLSKLVLPAAKESYDLMLLTYSVGKADFFRLNDARTTWVQAQKDLLTTRQSLAQFYNQLIAQVGCDFGTKEGPHAC